VAAGSLPGDAERLDPFQQRAPEEEIVTDPAPPRPVPGPPRPGPVSDGSAPFAGLADRPVSEHVALFEGEYERLQRELSTIDQL
jgi:hypothetical protein